MKVILCPMPRGSELVVIAVCLVSCLMIVKACAAEGGNPAPGPVTTPAKPADDPYLWLEGVTEERALAWVKEQNAVSTRQLEAGPEFGQIQQRLLAILDSKERIPYVAKHGAWYYNFWRDEKN